MSNRLTYTVPEVAELLGISRSTAYDCIRRGEIPALALGRRIVVSRSALAAQVDGEHSGPMESRRSARADESSKQS